MIVTVLLVVLLILAVGGFRNGADFALPGGLLGAVLLILIILLILGYR
jgi:hypothetical protein